MTKTQNKILTDICSMSTFTLGAFSYNNKIIYSLLHTAVYSLAILMVISWRGIKIIEKNERFVKALLNYYEFEYKKLGWDIVFFVISLIPILFVSALLNDYFLSIAVLISIGSVLLFDADMEKLVNDNHHLKENLDFKLK